MARSTEAWLLTLRENLAGVEQDTEEAFETRQELAKLLAERIRIGRGVDGRPRVEITYRFGPPEPAPASPGEEYSADGVRDSEEFVRVNGQGGGEGLLRGDPRMTSYEVVIEHEPERYYGPD